MRENHKPVVESDASSCSSMQDVDEEVCAKNQAESPIHTDFKSKKGQGRVCFDDGLFIQACKSEFRRKIRDVQKQENINFQAASQFIRLKQDSFI